MSNPSILIGDVGASSARWACLHQGQVTYRSSPGFNPRTHGPDGLRETLAPLADFPKDLGHVYYYGTGILTEADKQVVRQPFLAHMPDVRLHLYSDMEGAARSTGRSPAIVCILGTGSNSCVYDGGKIVDKIPTLGYPHGDEGSGWRIGMALIESYYHRRLPLDILPAFKPLVSADHTEFLKTLAQHIAPNRYLASFARFAAERQSHAWIREMVRRRFEAFLQHHVLPYEQEYPVHCIGGIANAFADILQDTLSHMGLKEGGIQKDPLAGLVQYHNKEI